MSSKRSQLSVAEKLDLIPAFASIAVAAFVAAVDWPFRSSARANSYYHHIIHSVVRQFSRRFSISQAQWIETPFIDLYKKYCSKLQLRENIVTISPFTEGLWVGDEDATYVLVYFHGGAFVFDGDKGHLEFWGSVRETLKARGICLAILFVAYPLIPHAYYPTQFREAVNAVRYVLETGRHPPSKIIIGGDSAGGNLAAATILHATSPSDLAPPLPKTLATDKLKGLLLMSPWINFDVSLPSFERNRKKDYLTAEMEKRWSDLYVNRNSPSPYNEPVRAEDRLWSSIPVQEILVTAGSNEALIQGVDEWVENLKACNPNVTYKVAPNEPHEAPIIWTVFGDNRETETGRNIHEWLEKLLGTGE